MINRILKNRYELLEKIGTGGMADVYKAHDQLLDRYVAIKILKQDFVSDEAFIEKFKRESLAVAKLSHHKIVNIYDVGEEEGIYYIVMEYAAGKTLKDKIKEKQFLSQDEVIHIGMQIAEALKHAHMHHIVHRDIKPQNIIVDEENNIKVADFGIARTATQNTVNFEKDVMGSVHYSSPEQAKGRLTDEKSDLYSLGIVMYEMATGILPFEGESPITVAYKQIKESVHFPAQMENDISEGLKALILKAVEKDQSLRYQTAQEMMNDLNALKEKGEHFTADRKKLDDMNTMVMPKVIVQDHKMDETVFQTQKISVHTESIQNNMRPGAGGFGFASEQRKEEDEFEKNKKKAPKEKKKWESILIPVIAVLVAFALVVAFTIQYLTKSFKSKEIEVPHILDYTTEEATKLLKEKGINLVVDAEIYDSEKAAGIILDQNPQGGMHIKSGDVHVVVSKGTEEVSVPDILDMNTNEAAIKLEKLGLSLGDVNRVYSTKEVGYIVEQIPAPKAQVPKGTAIDVSISKGEEQKFSQMPKIIALSRSKAEAEIVNAKLVVGEVREDYSDKIEAGLVMEQSFKEGMEVLEGTKINFVISKGKAPAEETPTEPGEPTDDEKLVERELLIRLPEGEGAVLVSVKKVDANGEKAVYEERHNKEEKGIRVVVKDKGTVKYKIYFDEVYANDLEVSF